MWNAVNPPKSSSNERSEGLNPPKAGKVALFPVVVAVEENPKQTYYSGKQILVCRRGTGTCFSATESSIKRIKHARFFKRKKYVIVTYA